MPASPDMSPPAPTAPPINSAARIRMAQIAAANAAVEAQRQQAPGAIQAGSPQEAQVRQEALNAQQQALIQGGYSRVGSSPDQFATQRQTALQSGSFNYAAVGYASRGTPASYVNTLGTRITVPQGGITGGGFAPGSVGVPSPTSKVNVMTDSGFIINISQAQLQKTNQLRAEQGLPPLQSVDQVNVVKGTQSLPLTMPTSIIARPTAQPPPRPSTGLLDLRSELATLQGKASLAISSSGIAVPFLTLTSPFIITKGQTKTVGGRTGGIQTEYILQQAPSKGTSTVPSTTIFDALQFLPFGGLAGRSATEALRGAGSLASKTITTGGEIIPKGFKPPEERNVFENIINYFSKPSETAQPSQPSIQNIALGRGLGREVSTTEEGGLSLSSKPSGKPPPEPPRTTSAGKGLEQIVKEKEEVPTKTETKTTQETVSKTEPLREQEMQKYQEQLTGKGKAGLGSEQELETLFLVTPPQTKQKTEQIGVPFIPSGLQTPAIPIVTPKKQEQRIETIGIVDQLTGQVTRERGGLPEIPSFADITTTQVTRQTTKQTPEQTSIMDQLTGEPTRGTETPPPDILGGGIGAGLTGGGGIGSGSSRVKSFVGNVPEFDIIGVYKREEIIYGNPKGSKSSSPMGKLFRNKASKIL